MILEFRKNGDGDPAECVSIIVDQNPRVHVISARVSVN